jgi:HEAT repeat protein
MRGGGGGRTVFVLGVLAAAVAAAAALFVGREWRRTEALLRLLDSEDEGEALAAAEELGERREPLAIPRLFEVFRRREILPEFPDEIPDRFRAMARAIIRRGIPPDALVDLLGDPYLPVAVFAAWILGTMGQGADPAIPGLARALQSDHTEIRSAAAEALAGIGTPGTVPSLLTALGDRHRDVSGWGRRGLLAVAAPSDESIPLLARLVTTGVPDDRVIAAGVLEKAGPRAAGAAKALAMAARSAEAEVRLACAKALAAIGPAAEEALQDAARSEDPAVGGIAREALSKIR